MFPLVIFHYTASTLMAVFCKSKSKAECLPTIYLISKSEHANILGIFRMRYCAHETRVSSFPHVRTRAFLSLEHSQLYRCKTNICLTMITWFRTMFWRCGCAVFLHAKCIVDFKAKLLICSVLNILNQLIWGILVYLSIHCMLFAQKWVPKEPKTALKTQISLYLTSELSN